MARFPTYERRRTLQGGATASMSGSQAFTAPARALQQGGADIADLGTHFVAQQEKFDKFKADTQLVDFSTAQDRALMDAKQNMEPGAEGFHDNFMSRFDQNAQEFTQSLPDHIRPQYELGVAKLRNTYAQKAATTQVKERNRFYSAETDRVVETSILPGITDRESADQAIEQADRVIETTGLSEVEKDIKRREAREKAAGVYVDRLIEQDPHAAVRELRGRGKALPKQVMTRAAQARDFFVSRGYTPEQSAGIVGNLVQESGVNPAGASGDGGTAHGMAQWRGARFNRLKRYAASQGRDWRDFETQLQFIDVELQNHETGAYEALKNAKTVDEATAAFISYERPAGWTSANPRAGHGWENRLEAARSVSGASADAPEGDSLVEFLPYEDRQDYIDTAVKEIEKRGDEQAVADYFAGHDTFNAYDPDSRKAVDKAFENAGIGQRVFDGDPGAIDGAVRISQETGYTPKSVFESVRGLLTSENEEQRERGHAIGSSILSASPNAFDLHSGSDGVVKDIETRQHFINDRGMTPEAADERIAEINSPEFTRLEAAREKDAQTLADAYEADDVSGLSPFDGWFTFQPELGADTNEQAVILGQFRDSFKENYIRTGDSAAAEKLALNELTRSYGLSTVSGENRVMRHPPETYYPMIGGSHGYLREQLVGDVQKEVGAEIEQDSIYLRADPVTDREVRMGRSPAYRAYYRDADGIIQTIPGRWTPDIDTARAAFQERFAAEREQAERDRFMREFGFPASEMGVDPADFGFEPAEEAPDADEPKTKVTPEDFGVPNLGGLAGS